MNTRALDARLSKLEQTGSAEAYQQSIDAWAAANGIPSFRMGLGIVRIEDALALLRADEQKLPGDLAEAGSG